MIYVRFAPAVVLLLAAALPGCGSSDGDGKAPEGVACASSASAADTESAKKALASAGAGSCVLLTGASYAGPLAVPQGVTITAPAGSRTKISGGTVKEPTVTLAPASALVNVDIDGAPGVAIAVRAESATIRGVNVTGAKTAALAVLCEGDGCAKGLVKVESSRFDKSSLGVWVSNAHVMLSGGSSSEHASQSLTASAGVIAANGATIALENFTIQKNQGAGILIDGPTTKATINGSTIAENGERGVWIQRVSGTIDAPAVEIHDSTIVKNKIVGLGSVEARGIIVIGGRIAETQAAPVVTNLATTEQVGDGVGVFGNSSDIKVTSTIEANVRAAGLVDGSERGIIVIGGKVGAGASGLKVVVQSSAGADVQVDASDKSMPSAPLGVSAPKLTLPPIGL